MNTKSGLKREIQRPLGDDDLKLLLPGIRILRYPELKNCRHIEDVLDPEGRLVVLFLTEDQNTGHWQCVYKRDDGVLCFFDSFGMRPDQAFDWLSPKEERHLGQTRAEITRLLKDAVSRGVEVVYNTVQYQSTRGDVNTNTCGRGCAVRLLFKNLEADDFHELVEAGNGDDFVTRLTQELLLKQRQNG